MTKIVEVPSIQVPLVHSPGFEKKELSDFKIDLLALCQYGCAFCSSNFGNYLRMRRKQFADLTEAQTGERTLPAEDPDLMFVWVDILAKVEAQLANKDRTWGAGETIVFSMLTDGFSPLLVKQGVTEKALRLILDRTSFRIRVLTKNAIVGSPYWIRLFREFRDRFVVGLSIGTNNDRWARAVERKTPAPSARLKALRKLQDAGVPTYGMLCPVFAEMLDGDALERLLDATRPELVEHVWAEPYNDRQNWGNVRECLPSTSPTHRWLTDVYEHQRRDLWSKYATDLYVRLRQHAERHGWLSKLRYLLYEADITPEDALRFGDCSGVLLQAKPDDLGRSRNPAFADLSIGKRKS